MTPKNRADLVELMRDTIADSCGDGDRTIAHDILDDLDAAGLAIVPKEPTDWMSQAGIAALSKAEVDPAHYMAEHLPVYRAMLEASPFKEGTTLQQKEPGE